MMEVACGAGGSRAASGASVVAAGPAGPGEAAQAAQTTAALLSIGLLLGRMGRKLGVPVPGFCVPFPVKPFQF